MADEYAGLTNRGKLRRLRGLAEEALTHYDMDVADLRFHCFATNLLYRIRTSEGERLVLRLASPAWRTLEDLEAEASWLAALHVETDVGAPFVLPSVTGECVLPMTSCGVPHTWHASLMTWVDGRLLAHHLTEGNLGKMGKLFARLHIHGGSWKPPRGFTTRRFEAFLSRGEPNVLFDGVALSGADAEDVRALSSARDWVEREYASLSGTDLRVIHCDLWHENIKLDRGALRPFDFEDTIWGYRLHDIAMGMLDLLETVGLTRYRRLLSAFRDGYESLLEWPEGSLEVLQIGRMLWILNYVARFESEHLLPMVRKHAAVFREFGSTGELRLPN